MLVSAPADKKIQVIKVVRELTSLGLKEAKDLVEGAPKPVKTGVTKEECDTMKKKLEETREAVQRTVVSPVRHISGLMHGVTAGVEAFFSRRRGRSSGNVPQDEMFI